MLRWWGILRDLGDLWRLQHACGIPLKIPKPKAPNSRCPPFAPALCRGAQCPLHSLSLYHSMYAVLSHSTILAEVVQVAGGEEVFRLCCVFTAKKKHMDRSMIGISEDPNSITRPLIVPKPFTPYEVDLRNSRMGT